MNCLTSYVLLVGFFATGFARLIDWEPCGSSNAATEATCTIHQVDIEPCTLIDNWFLCLLARDTTANITFDFTPNFSGEDLQSSVIWKHYYMDLPMPETWSDANPCGSTRCPLTAGTRQTYSYTVSIPANTWPKTYPLEYKLWNSEGKSCCFNFAVELVSRV